MSMSTFGSCLVGLKGLLFLQELLDSNVHLSVVNCYNQPDDQSFSFEKINALCNEYGINFIETKQPDLSQCDHYFFVGWQFLVNDHTEKIIVFHDSILPAYRGFAPTVTALINGDTEIGISAIAAAEKADCGPVYAQQTIKITYPIKILEAFRLQAKAAATIAQNLIKDIGDNSMHAKQQDESMASYSLWRDEQDYFMDWQLSAEQLARHIDACGYPYTGAKTFWQEEVITIVDASPVEDMNILLRSPGKTVSIEDNKPIVVCGIGCLRIDLAVDSDNKPITFNRLRSRFHSPSL